MSYEFKAGDVVIVSKPESPLIAWNDDGLMDQYDGTKQVILSITSNHRGEKRAKLVGCKRNYEYWSFSLDCLTKVVEESETVIDFDGNEILRSEAVFTTLDGWVHEDYVIYAEDGESMHCDNHDDHEYEYDRHGNLYPRDCLYFVYDTGEYHHESEDGISFFYHQSEQEYYSYPPSSGQRHGYHDGPRHDYSDGSKFRFGVEVEKEDDEVFSYDLSDVDVTGWSRESDGSLDEETGFELVSPMYDLFGDKFDDDLSKDILRDHINADISNNCGGHMGFSIKGKQGTEVFDLYNGFFPILFAMYRHRLRGSWSKVRDNKTLKQGNHKYSAVNVQYNYVEFRIFSAVKNVTNLLWRRDLLRIMAKNPKKGVMWWISQAMNPNSSLHNHLLKVYDADKIRLICAYAAAIAERMNGRDYGKYIHFADEEAKQSVKQFVNNL